MNVSKGLKGVVAAQTALSLVDGESGILLYRGEHARELALTKSFEEVAYFIWHQTWPSLEELHKLKKRFKEARSLPGHVQTILDSLPLNTSIMSALRTAISSLGTEAYSWKPTLGQAIVLTAMTPTIISYWYRRKKGEEFVPPRENLDFVANYLYMLNGEVPKTAHVRALEAYMILTMEHGFNASTFSARVTASTESDMISAITAAVGTMKGPLHGGAPSGVIEMLEEIGSIKNADQWIDAKLSNNERIMGFGHRVYKTKDPRAESLRQIAQEVGAEDEWLALANQVEERVIEKLAEWKPGRKLYTNVEYYAAAVMRAIEMEKELFTPTFSASRMVGWTAHVIEQADDNTIYRPQAEYIGKVPAL
ncbi:citrate synthase/methylcitrate synthase [Bacillus litorisediminis]|uniref:citrate synthase/methylcitrate synthase n=1 Tax=Bacillus litorisediminis TaxID=2922713 RepID=UPI001FAECD28|nr:citrate synthase/methylcitrate synthase [Bacillus litorisediminis]